MDYTKQWFESLFKDSYPHMYRMAYSMVKDADDAKDAVHQVFAQIWKGKPKVSEDSMRGYLLPFGGRDVDGVSDAVADGHQVVIVVASASGVDTHASVVAAGTGAGGKGC